MGTTNDGRSESPREAGASSPEAVTAAARPDQSTLHEPAAQAEREPQSDEPASAQPIPPESHPPSHSRRKWLLLAGMVAGLAAGGYVLVPMVRTALNTVSTDDAYVNGHVTFVAP